MAKCLSKPDLPGPTTNQTSCSIIFTPLNVHVLISNPAFSLKDSPFVLIKKFFSKIQYQFVFIFEENNCHHISSVKKKTRNNDIVTVKVTKDNKIAK